MDLCRRRISFQGISPMTDDLDIPPNITPRPVDPIQTRRIITGSTGIAYPKGYAEYGTVSWYTDVYFLDRAIYTEFLSPTLSVLKHEDHEIRPSTISHDLCFPSPIAFMFLRRQTVSPTRRRLSFLFLSLPHDLCRPSCERDLPSDTLFPKASRYLPRSLQPCTGAESHTMNNDDRCSGPFSCRRNHGSP